LCAQTKRLKQEKEQQKLKARKQRDAFLLMLAENTDIDARTRWKDAVAILQDDARYKNVEDARDREELFEEFIAELEKKEKEDKRRARDDAVAAFARLLKDHTADGKVNRKSIWADTKKLFVDVMVRSDFRSLEEADFRRAFQSFTAELEEEFQVAERRRRAELERHTAACQAELRALLEGMARDGKLTGESRWKDCLELDSLGKSAVMEKLRALYPASEDRSGNALNNACRPVFDAVQSKVYEQYRQDKRLVKDLLNKHGWKVRHDTTFADFKAFALKLARVRETEDTVEAGNNGTGHSADAPAGKLLVEPVAGSAGRSAEDGEEVDEAPFEQLRTMMLDRPAALAQVFSELHRKAVTDHEEEQQWMRKVERKFNTVLAENFYLPEHAAIPWDDAKKALQRRSVYDELGKSDRRRLFAEHMAALASGAKLPAAVAAAEGSTEPSRGDGGKREDSRRDDRRAETSRRSRSRSNNKQARPEVGPLSRYLLLATCSAYRAPCFRVVQPVRRGEGREVRDVSKDRVRRHSQERDRDRGDRDRERERDRDSHRDKDREGGGRGREREREERGAGEDEERRKRARGGEAH
jgi:mannitol/fructose-specific phosphotransferase system IIA component (Ntr-type)